MSNFSSLNAPPNKSSINLEITTSENSSIWLLNEDEIVNQLINSLHKIGLIQNENDIEFFDLTKWKNAYIFYNLTYRENIKKIKDYFENLGIILFGRFGLYEYLNMDQIFLRAIELAEKIQHR